MSDWAFYYRGGTPGPVNYFELHYLPLQVAVRVPYAQVVREIDSPPAKLRFLHSSLQETCRIAFPHVVRLARQFLLQHHLNPFGRCSW